MSDIRAASLALAVLAGAIILSGAIEALLILGGL